MPSDRTHYEGKHERFINTGKKKFATIIPIRRDFLTGDVWGPKAISKLRILHVITRFVNGGADENTMLTCNHQAEAGHEVYLVHGRDWTARMVERLHPDVKVVSMPSLVREVSPAEDLSTFWKLAGLTRDIRPDIIHTHTSKAGIIGRFAAVAWARAKVVHGVHILPFTNEPLPKRWVYVLLEKLAALRTHAFIDVSEGMRDLCLAHGLGRAENHFVVRSGMNLSQFRYASPADDLGTLRQSRQGAIIAGYVAVLEPRKRHRELIESVASLLRQRSEIFLVLAGDGPERPYLERLVEQEGLRENVHFLGFREDVERIVAGCDICVFASQREGLPRSVVQYVIAGKPIVASHLPGINRVLNDGENGFIVHGDGLADLAERIEKLALDQELRAEFSAASAAMDLSAWDGRTMTEQIEAIYSRVRHD